MITTKISKTMKRSIINHYSVFLLLAVMLFAGCQKKVDLKGEWQDLYGRTEAAFSAAQTQDEAEAVLQNLIDSAYLLLNEHMDAVYADTLFGEMYYMFSPEQKEALFAKMSRKQLEQDNIAQLHKTFLIEQSTSAGQRYIDIRALQPNGEELALSDLVGQTDFVLVDFWASWCGPCRRLIPVLQEIYAGQPKGRLQILSCSVDRDEAKWRQALDEEQMPWPQIHEVEGEYECSDLYGVRAIPTTILIDREGNIIARNPDEAELESILFGE